MPKDHPSHFVVALVREHLDLSEIEASYASTLGQPAFHPALMTALLLNGYASGIGSSRRIAKACRERADFMMIVAGDPPDFRTISDFRKRHLQALKQLFVQVLKLCEAAGLAKLGHVAFDGSKIKANASKHKAMSYGRMEARASELEAEVDKWLAAAEATDAAEDQLYGRDKRGEELPAWVADKKRRAAKIRAAQAELEATHRAGTDAELTPQVALVGESAAGLPRPRCDAIRHHVAQLKVKRPPCERWHTIPQKGQRSSHTLLVLCKLVLSRE